MVMVVTIGCDDSDDANESWGGGSGGEGWR